MGDSVGRSRDWIVKFRCFVGKSST
jgi:hypothetical protein